MPRQLDYFAPQVDTRMMSGQAQNTTSVGLATAGAHTLEQAGAAITGATDMAVRIAADMQEQINQTQRMDASNKLHGVVQDLLYNPQSGFLVRKGDAAFKPDEDGVTPSAAFNKRMQEEVAKLSTGLGNERQRKMFAQDVGSVTNSFNSTLSQHSLNEFYSYNKSVVDGQIKVAADEAARNWDDPVAIDTNVAKAQGALVQMGKLTGMAPLEVEAKLRATSSSIYSKAILAAVENGNLGYASALLKANSRDRMVADDILQINKLMHVHVDQGVSQAAVGAASDAFKDRFMPTATGSLESVVKGLESGGLGDYKDGKPLTSAKGALYAMQVMPATAKNPGFGVKPAQNDSPEEYNRVGREYLAAMTKEFGTVSETLAAYNAGPGAVKDAHKAADKAGRPANWLDYMPKETQDYVRKGVAKFGSGQTTPEPPTELEFVNHAVKLLGPNATPEQIKLTRSGAEHQYTLFSKAVKQQGEQAVVKVYQEVAQNGGDVTALSPESRTNLFKYAPGKIDDVLAFGKRIREGAEAKTDNELYMHLATYPEEMAKLSDAQFLQLKTKLSDSDFKHFSNARADYLSGKKTDTAESINRAALNSALENRLTVMGVDPKPKHSDKAGREQVGTIQKYLSDSIFTQQKQLGRKMTAEEIDTFVSGAFLKDNTFRRTLMGLDFGSGSQNMLTMKVGDIPGDSLKTIKEGLAKRGVANPTDDLILRSYWKWKNNG